MTSLDRSTLATAGARRDAIILGSDPSALVAAAYLARAGRRVLVLEPREQPGGAWATQELIPGCRIDPVFDDVGWLPREIATDLDLRRHGLELVEPDPMVVAPGKRGGHLALWRDQQRTRESIRALAAKDAERWPTFAAEMARHASIIEALYEAAPPRLGGTPDRDDLTGLFRLARRVGLAGRADLLELSRVAPMPIGELLDDWFESDTLKSALALGGVQGLLQGPRSGGTAFLFLHRHVGGGEGAVRARQIARGGSAALIAALVAAARAAGAEVRVGSAPAKLRIDASRIRGVVLADGSELEAPVVLSSLDPRATLLELAGPSHLDPELVGALQHVRYRGATARVHFAVDELPRFRGLEERGLLAGAIVLATGLDDIERAYDDAKHGRLSARPALEVVIPTLADPSRAPAATHVLSVTVNYAPWHLRDGGWTDARRDELGRLVLGMLTEHAPGIRETVVGQCVLSPADLERCHGLREGSIDQGEMTLDQILFMRPLPALARYGTPVEGLWLCGPATHPGGRVPGMSGRLAAREILKAGGR